ncbi:hypothetical protein CEE34_10845 [Candidatus Aerophobetes bacterium Ae_b3a]|nr:MAG: hypothetical protein CEE34_10845 [Candidatus Aerophobetes bacterium Ae_b3a]
MFMIYNIGMFLKRCARIHKGKTYQSWWIVEAHREKGKIKHRYIMNVTRFTPSQRKRIVKLLRSPDAQLIEDMEEFFQEGVGYGDIVFFLYQIRQLGVTSILKKYLSRKALSLTLAVMLNRIIRPSSKMEAIEWIKETSFPHFCPLKEKDYQANRVYEAMDKVYDDLDNIMEDFYQLSEEKPLFLLYDVTSVYFEGRCVKKAKNGYSRDRRPDRPQVLLGLVLNEKGFPIHFEIFEGNLKDSETLQGVVKKVKERFGLEKGIIVGDRGMITTNNIEAIAGESLGYIMALKHEGAKNFLREKRIQLELFDKRLPLTIFEEEGKKYILCGSEYRKERDSYVFNKLLEKGKEALEVVERMIRQGRLKKYEKVIRRAQKKLTESGATRYYDFSYEEEERKFTIIEKENEIEKAKALCGYYVLKTSEVEMQDDKVEEHYKKLREVEQVFRDLKDLIDIRPIYHWIDRRVKTHIFLCLLSQVVLGRVRKRLKEKGWLGKKKENTLERFITLLGTVQLGEFSLEDKTILRVQKKNPLEKILQRIFDLSPSHLARDTEICRV